MDKKDEKKLEEIYWKEDAYALRSLEEIENEIRRSRNFYINELSEEQKKINFEDEYKSIFQLNAFDKDFAEKLVSDISLGSISYSTCSWILANGMYQSYKTNDMSFLKNALHTTNRLSYGNTLTTCSGYNHSGSFEDVIYAFADCDIELVKKYLPKVHGLADSKTMPFFRASCNLIMGMIYENVDWIKEGRSQCAKFNERKSSAKYDVLVVSYLLALSNKDAATASALLQQIANSYRKTSWLFNFKSEFLKLFGVYVHGLYNIGYFALDHEIFNQIQVPEHSVFWKEFDLYTKTNNFSKGKPILSLNNDLKSIRRLFDE